MDEIKKYIFRIVLYVKNITPENIFFVRYRNNNKKKQVGLKQFVNQTT